MRRTQVPSGITSRFGVHVSKYFDLISRFTVTPQYMEASSNRFRIDNPCYFYQWQSMIAYQMIIYEIS